MISITTMSGETITLSIKLNYPYTYEKLNIILLQHLHSMQVYVLIHNNDIFYNKCTDKSFKYSFEFGIII